MDLVLVFRVFKHQGCFLWRDWYGTVTYSKHFGTMGQKLIIHFSCKDVRNISGLLEAVNIHLNLPAYIFTHTFILNHLRVINRLYTPKRGFYSQQVDEQYLLPIHCDFFYKEDQTILMLGMLHFCLQQKQSREKRKSKKTDTKSKLSVPFTKAALIMRDLPEQRKEFKESVQ